ncbi:MAG TPA: PSD1 and planctomycete cytochrome C domain-containing protein [Pirellulales bacterium]|nr:PSD1 and planctomycete cytochrome C domain-containing protein [Pirellulales bacterium]
MKPFGFALAAIVLLAVTRPLTAAGDKVDFARDIRPFLSANCFKCHGPDDTQRQAELRLDTQAGAFAERDGHFAFVAGKPDASEVWKRITSADPDERMPPADSGKTLTEAQIALIRKWIDEGAAWSQHWAFVPPQRPALPAIVAPAAQNWIRNPIDAFVLARLQKEGLQPAPQADAVTLLRRLSLDLVGLPPSIAEVDVFLADGFLQGAASRPDAAHAQDAYDRQVDRLLDSPHYGERWGRLWLDAARYADSDGYEKDKPRQVWAYRDWVIAALNRDLPYDRFVVEQIAGDLLPDATQDQLVATGFLRNSMINEEGGIDPEQFRMEAMFDRMDAIGKSVLGLTIQCAQCHSHKFDPLTHEEYYRMFAFLNDCHEANAAVYAPQQKMERAEIVRGIQAIEADLQHRTPDWQERMAQWESSVRGNQPEWVVVQPEVEPDSSGGQKYIPLDDGSLLCQGYAPTKHRAELTVKTDVQNITAFRLEMLNHNDLPLAGPGRSIQGTGALTEFVVEAAPADRPQEVTKVKLAKATADLDLPEKPLEAIYDDNSGRTRVTGPVSMALDEKDETAWGIDAGPGRRNQPRKAVFNAETPIANAAGTILTFCLTENHGGWNSDDNQNHNLGRFRLSVTTAADAVADPLPAAVREILAVPIERRTPAQTAAVFSFWRTTVPEWQEANAQIEELWKRHPEGASQLVLVARSQPRETHMLVRGDFLKPDKTVSPGVPSFLHPFAADGPVSRLSFAEWLVDRNSPTTARALVNRVWQSYFGTGLVSTSEDLGSQSEAPSHGELLDWRAVEFMDRGWSLKSLHKLIVTSSTYRQSARVTPELHARDPYNRLLARGPRLRVEAETVRDIALAASGLLNAKLGGPSVYPPAPDFLFQPPVSYGPKVWRGSVGDDRYRRAIYTFRYRSVPYPALQTFDAPNGDFSCVRRVRSNTPLQALVTLNEPLFVECAQALAWRTLGDGGTSDEARLSYAFRRCLARAPDEVERQELLSLLARETKHFAEGWVNPKETAFASANQQPELPAGTTPTQLAAWTMVARVLLNLDETITKE